MHAGFQLIEMSLHAKARLLHKVGGEKSVDGRHNPRVFFHVAVAEPQFHHAILVCGIHGLSNLRLCFTIALYQFLR